MAPPLGARSAGASSPFGPDPALVAAFNEWARALHCAAQTLGHTAWLLRFAAGLFPWQEPTLSDTERLFAAFSPSLELLGPVGWECLGFAGPDHAVFWPRKDADETQARDGLAWAVGRFLLGPDTDDSPAWPPSLPNPAAMAKRPEELSWLASFFRWGWETTREELVSRKPEVLAALAVAPERAEFRGPWAETAYTAAYRLWAARQEGGQAG